MKKLTQTEVDSILDKHQLYLNRDFDNGKIAHLSNLDLSDLIFNKQTARGVNFSKSDLSGTTFWDCDLFNADFTGANMSGVDFHHSDIRHAKFEDVAGIGFNEITDFCCFFSVAQIKELGYDIVKKTGE